MSAANELREAWDQLRTTRMPSSAASTELDDWMTSLLQLDADLARLALTALAGREIQMAAPARVLELQTELNAIEITRRDRGVHRACRDYLDALGRVERALVAAKAD